MCLLLNHAVHVRVTCLKAMRRTAQKARCGGGRAVPSRDSPTRMRDDGTVPCLEFCSQSVGVLVTCSGAVGPVGAVRLLE